MTGILLAVIASVTAFEVEVKGLGAVEFACSDGGSIRLDIGRPDRGPNKGGIQNDEHQYISYGDRVRRQKEKKPMPPFTPVSNCVVNVSSRELKLNQTLFLLPYFHSSYGLYSHADIVKNLDFWRSRYQLIPDKDYRFTFVPAPEKNRTYFYYDGSILCWTNAVLDVVSAKTSGGLELVSSRKVEHRATPGTYELPRLAAPSRANDLLKRGAKLSIEPGERVINGIPMTVWGPEDSIDQGRHHRTSSHRGLCSDPQYDRLPWKTGWEYMQWIIPGSTWSHAWILCADLGFDGCVPVVGTQLSKLGHGCTGGNIDVEKVNVEGGKGWCVKVGELTYRLLGDGVKTVPLYLVRVDFDPGKLGARGSSATLDFEFVGAGAMGTQERSSVQIFGATLVEAPYGFKVDNPVRGNIFEQGTDEQRCRFVVTSNVDDMKGSVEYEIYGPLFNSLEKGVISFAIAKHGESKEITLDLSKYGLGWYGMDFVFKDADGKTLANHEAAFTVLAPDDREAGYESPYAAWPHSNGYHGSNPDPMGPRTVMRKAGYRNSWEPPVASEEEGRPWKIGLNTAGYKFCQPGSPRKSRAELDAHFDRAVAAIKEQIAAFPHCKVIQLLHEQGGREISKEVAAGRKGVRGEYRGWKFEDEFPELKKEDRGDWEVYFCTEYAKRLRSEFPDMKIMIGNGSSSCEKIASLMRRGFDLSLIDQLGIESKGFGTMPEYCANQESPGMLWALRETGRAFGYTNFTLNACNEYVFRTERKVSRDWSPRKIMQVTDYTLRDYLISMAHGCTIISTGHLEDAADAYYDTNWGAGGQCKAYPYSYPKRMFTGLAVMTRVLDCPKFIRRVPTESNTAIVFEFERQRQKKDYAYAIWSPTHENYFGYNFPEGSDVTVYSWDGVARKVKPYGVLTIGSTVKYLVSSTRIQSAKYLPGERDELPAGAKKIFVPSAENLVMLDEPIHDRRWYWGLPDATNGNFAVRSGSDSLIVERIPDDRRIPQVVWEGRNFALKKPIKLKLSQLKGFGMMIRGNGSYGKVKLLITKEGNESPYEIECGDRGYITFDGWHFVDMDLSEWTPPCGWLRGVDEVTLEKIQVGMPRYALDPLEMKPTSGAIGIGAIYALPKSGINEISVEESQSRRAWENTEDKDR